MASDLPDLLSIDLPDAAVVVRHGQMHVSDLQKAAQAFYDRYEIYAISASASTELDADGIAMQSQLEHAQIRETTAGRLRSAGFEVEYTRWQGHVTIKFPGVPTDDLLEQLRSLFGDCRRNPKLLRS